MIDDDDSSFLTDSWFGSYRVNQLLYVPYDIISYGRVSIYDQVMNFFTYCIYCLNRVLSHARQTKKLLQLDDLTLVIH